MIFFCIKKWFYDCWDNLLLIGLSNVFADFFIFVPFLLMKLGGANTFLSLGLMVVGCIPFGVYLSVAARWAREIAFGNVPRVNQILVYLKEGWLQGMVLTLIQAVVILILYISLTYYGVKGDTISLIAFGLVSAGGILWALLGPFQFPIHTQYEPKIGKTLKKSFMVMMDNPGFAFGQFIVSALILALSVVLVLLFPGVLGALVFQQVCFKCRMYKYDYLDANPEAKRTDIPWDVVLAEEKARVGKRSLRNLIFPWRD